VPQHRRAGARRGGAAWRALPFLLATIALVGPHAAVAARLDQLPQQWRDDQGRAWSFSELQGRRVFLAMAYTSCHRTCPTTVNQLRQVQRLLDQHGEQASIVIVGLDPDHDDPASWRHYRSSHGLTRDNWHFLTGTAQQARQVANTLGVGFWTYDTHVMHDSRIVVFDKSGLLSATIDPAKADWSGLF
jgi:cytochrome oxidase Cu insertion factor (SCO1/SenC/PrrC family)